MQGYALYPFRLTNQGHLEHETLMATFEPSGTTETPKAANTNTRPTRTTAEMLIAAAALSPEIHDWISRQIMAGQKPSEILVRLPGQVGQVLQ